MERNVYSLIRDRVWNFISPRSSDELFIENAGKSSSRLKIGSQWLTENSQVPMLSYTQCIT